MPRILSTYSKERQTVVGAQKNLVVTAPTKATTSSEGRANWAEQAEPEGEWRKQRSCDEPAQGLATAGHCKGQNTENCTYHRTLFWNMLWDQREDWKELVEGSVFEEAGWAPWWTTWHSGMNSGYFLSGDSLHLEKRGEAESVTSDSVPRVKETLGLLDRQFWQREAKSFDCTFREDGAESQTWDVMTKEGTTKKAESTYRKWGQMGQHTCTQITHVSRQNE